jgi:DNA-binding response OmpR family regulator
VNRVIYLRNGEEPDKAIEQTLIELGADVVHTHTIVETLQAISTAIETGVATPGALSATLLIVAEVHCGGIPLLMVIREEMIDAPSVMLLDRANDNVRYAVQALQLGASDYLLSSDSEAFRAERTRSLFERMRAQADELPDNLVEYVRSDAFSTPTIADDVDWDPISNRIVVDNVEVHLTPIQARIFDRLWANRNATVSTEDLVRLVLLREDVNVRDGSRLLRPHLVRLRNALDHHPKLAHRIVNIRGAGYMLI